jgi:hypothetical protein
LNFDLQRQKNILPSESLFYLSFLVDFDISNILTVNDITKNTTHDINPDSTIQIGDQFLLYFKIPANALNIGSDVYFSVSSEADDGSITAIYSELYTIQSNDFLNANAIHKLTAYNNDNRHGYLTNQTFGYFRIEGYWSDIFINNKVEYSYSYGRKMILSSENQIIKRLTFLDLTMYNQNLLKWLCNCENLFIDGVRYNLISDFTELARDENSEICSLRADFVEVNQSFFAQPSMQVPTDVFPNQFFVTNGAPFVPYATLLNNISMNIDDNLELIYTTPDGYSGLQVNSIDGDLMIAVPDGYEGLNLNIERGNLMANN